MAVSILSTVEEAVKVYTIRVRLTSFDPIVDPVAYVSQPAVWMDILAIAGLPELLFVAAVLEDQGYLGREHWYDLIMTFDRTHVTATGHSHDSRTLHHPLREAYRDGPFIDLTFNLGPVDIWSDTDTVDYLRVRRQTGDDYLKIEKEGYVCLGSHVKFLRDCEFDIGTIDGGTTLRRPRDLYLCRDAYVGNDVTIGNNLAVGGIAAFANSVTATNYEFTAVASNPDNDPTHRHIYWNSGDNTLRSWNGSVEAVIGGAPVGLIGIYTCSPSVVIGDVVSVVGASIVAKADATILGLRPVIGIVVNKTDPTTAVVQLYGEVGVFVGLLPGQLYFLSQVPGQITNTLAGFNPGDTVQLVGVAKDTTTLTLRFESRVNL